MLERHKVEVDKLSSRPDLPVGQDDVYIILGEVVFYVLDAQPLKCGHCCYKDAEKAGSKQGLVHRHLGDHSLGA